VILLDEPTASLDAATRADVLADVERLCERGKSVLLISHRPEEVRQLALRTIWTLLQRELRDSLRNKWFLLYTLSFAGLALALAYLSNIGTGLAGMAGFGKTAASLVNLTLLVVSLKAVTMGAASLPSEQERGMLAYLLAQPVSGYEVDLAKFLGQGLAFSGAIALGFGLSAAALAQHGLGDSALFLRLDGLSVLLALSLLAIGMSIAVFARLSPTTTLRSSQAACGRAVNGDRAVESVPPDHLRASGTSLGL